jgi:putative endonuclease
MSIWTLYILQCNDGSLYTGITTDLQKRLKRHNQGCAAKYTRPRRPVKLVYSEVLGTESLARKREAEIKKLSRQSKLELIQ